MLEAKTSSRIPTNTYYTFTFTNQVYQLVLGVTEFYLQFEGASSLQRLDNLSISIREVARGENTLTIQPIMHAADGTTDLTSTSYVVVTVVAVTVEYASLQLNSGLGVQDGTTMTFANDLTTGYQLEQPILAAFSMSNGSTFRTTEMHLSAALGSVQPGSVGVKSLATMKDDSPSSRTTDVGLIINADPTFGLVRWQPSGRLQKGSEAIPNYDSYSNHVVFLVGYDVKNTSASYFYSLGGSATISGGSVSGYATLVNEIIVSGVMEHYNQDDSASGVTVVVLSWN